MASYIQYAGVQTPSQLINHGRCERPSVLYTYIIISRSILVPYIHFLYKYDKLKMCVRKMLTHKNRCGKFCIQFKK